jgi:enamine deaminase RidA (YjgF/YER057c/UK114 family)
MLRLINPPGPSIPGVSQAVLVESGRPLFLSGHVPFDESGSVSSPEIGPQLEQVFRNLDATLKAAGVGFESVARLTFYVCNLSPAFLPIIREVRDRWIKADRPPASVLIGVASLFRLDVLVEVDAFAIVPFDEKGGT